MIWRLAVNVRFDLHFASGRTDHSPTRRKRHVLLALAIPTHMLQPNLASLQCQTEVILRSSTSSVRSSLPVEGSRGLASIDNRARVKASLAEVGCTYTFRCMCLRATRCRRPHEQREQTAGYLLYLQRSPQRRTLLADTGRRRRI